MTIFRHGLFSVIATEREKRGGRYYSFDRKYNTHQLCINVCWRYLSINKKLTVGNWNKLIEIVSERITSPPASYRMVSILSIQVRANKEHLPITRTKGEDARLFCVDAVRPEINTYGRASVISRWERMKRQRRFCVPYIDRKCFVCGSRQDLSEGWNIVCRNKRCRLIVHYAVESRRFNADKAIADYLLQASLKPTQRRKKTAHFFKRINNGTVEG